MLVLSRCKDECIEINGEILIQVLEISGSRAKLGISAPKHMRINRSESNTTDKEQTNSTRMESDSSATSEDAMDSDSGRESGR